MDSNNSELPRFLELPGIEYPNVTFEQIWNRKQKLKFKTLCLWWKIVRPIKQFIGIWPH